MTASYMRHRPQPSGQRAQPAIATVEELLAERGLEIGKPMGQSSSWSSPDSPVEQTRFELPVPGSLSVMLSSFAVNKY